MTDKIALCSGDTAPLTFEDAMNAGYRVHCGTAEDGELSGMPVAKSGLRPQRLMTLRLRRLPLRLSPATLLFDR